MCNDIRTPDVISRLYSVTLIFSMKCGRCSVLLKVSRQLFYCPFFSFFRATLYVGKYSTSLYASPSLVHDGVTVVVSGCYMYASEIA